MTLQEQLAYFDRKGKQAYIRCLREFKGNPELIIAGARKRLLANGHIYGDSGFHRSFAELKVMRFEEYDDSVNYQLMSMYQGWD